MRYLKLYEEHEPEIASSGQMRRAIAYSSLPRLSQVYGNYINGDMTSFRELMYRIWLNLTHEDTSKFNRLETLGLFDPADISVEQLMNLPGVRSIVQVFDNTKRGSARVHSGEQVNSIFPGLVRTTAHDYGINYGRFEDGAKVDPGRTDITMIKGYIKALEGVHERTPMLILDEYYTEAWININDI